MGAWWSSFPGFQSKALEQAHRDAQSDITGERLFVERMAQRPWPETDPVYVQLHDEVAKKIDEIHAAAIQAKDETSWATLLASVRAENDPRVLSKNDPGSAGRGCGAEMVALEGAATVPGDEGGPTTPQRPKPVLPGAGTKPETSRARSS
jgi:hypothetical protein